MQHKIIQTTYCFQIELHVYPGWIRYWSNLNNHSSFQVILKPIIILFVVQLAMLFLFCSVWGSSGNDGEYKPCHRTHQYSHQKTWVIFSWKWWWRSSSLTATTRVTFNRFYFFNCLLVELTANGIPRNAMEKAVIGLLLLCIDASWY